MIRAESYTRLPTFCLDGSVIEHWGFVIRGNHGELERSQPIYPSAWAALTAGMYALEAYGCPPVPLMW